MTREEAIKVLTNLQSGHGVSYSEDYGLCFGHKWMQAYEMAIAALREQEGKTCETCYANDMAPDETDNPCWNCKSGHSEWAPREQDEKESCEWCFHFVNDRQYLLSQGNGIYREAMFEFCPMCGRRLEEV